MVEHRRRPQAAPRPAAEPGRRRARPDGLRARRPDPGDRGARRPTPRPPRSTTRRSTSEATTAAVRSLFAVVERYPDIKSAANVADLQDEIERLEGDDRRPPRALQRPGLPLQHAHRPGPRRVSWRRSSAGGRASSSRPTRPSSSGPTSTCRPHDRPCRPSPPGSPSRSSTSGSSATARPSGRASAATPAAPTSRSPTPVASRRAPSAAGWPARRSGSS